MFARFLTPAGERPPIARLWRDVRYPPINARVERQDTWYGWRRPWAGEHAQRCIFLMAASYEPRKCGPGPPLPRHAHDRRSWAITARVRKRRGHRPLGVGTPPGFRLLPTRAGKLLSLCSDLSISWSNEACRPDFFPARPSL